MKDRRECAGEWFLLGGRIVVLDNAGGNDFGRLLWPPSPDCVGDGSRASETTHGALGPQTWRVTVAGRKKIQLLYE